MNAILRIFAAVWNSGNYLLRLILRAAIVLILLMIVAARYLPDAVPYLTILFALAVLFILTEWPLATIIVGHETSAVRISFAAIGIILAIGAFFWIVPIDNDRGLAFFFILIVAAYLFLRAGRSERGRNSDYRWLRGILLIGIVVATAIWFLGGRKKALKTTGSIEQKIESALATRQAIIPAPTQSAARFPFTFPTQALIPTSPTAVPDPNGPCPGMASQVVDHNRAFEMYPVAMGQPFAFDARGDRLYPSDCFGPVLDLGALVSRGGFCGVPCYWNGEGCEVLDPDHTFTFWWQFVRQDASGNWVPIKTVGPLHWTNLPSDNPSLLNLPLTLRLKGVHSPNGGMTFMTLGQGTGGAKCPEADWPNASGSS